MNIFLTSDLWLYRHNAISMFGRPFETVQDMNNALIENWNGTVGDDDIVFVLGGFNYDSTKFEQIMNCLRGKVVLIPLTTDVLIANQNKNFFKYQFTNVLSCAFNKFEDVPDDETLNGIKIILVRAIMEGRSRKLPKDVFANQLYGQIIRYMISKNEVNAQLADMCVSLCTDMAYDNGDVKEIGEKFTTGVRDMFSGKDDKNQVQLIMDAMNMDAPVKQMERIACSEDPFIIMNKSIFELTDYGVVLSAYPMLDWNGKEHGVLNIHGGTTRSDLYEGRFNVRTDLCNFAPVSLASIVELNKIVKSHDKKADKGNKGA